jgi:hypothetical protein
MRHIKFTERINIVGTPEAIFDYTQDYKQRLVWDTFLKEARLLHDATQADYGVKAWCVAKNGMGMETEYISFNRPKVAAIKMIKGPYMFKDFAASWTFSNEADVTIVTFTYAYALRFPYNLLNRLITSKLKREVNKRLKDLKSRFIENALTTPGQTQL